MMISRRTGMRVVVILTIALIAGAIWWSNYSLDPSRKPFREIERISAGLPGPLGVDLMSGLVYAASGDDQSRITVIDGSKDRQVIPTASGYAQRIAVDSTHHWAYVLNYLTSDVTVVGADGSAVALPAGGDDAADIAIDEANGIAYVVSPWAKGTGRTVIEGHVTVLQGQQVIDEWVFPELQLYRAAFDPVGGLLYLADIRGIILVISRGKEVARFGLTPSQTGAESVISLVTNTHTGDVYGLTDGGVVQMKDGARVREYTSDQPGEFPYRSLSVHPASNELYVAVGKNVVVLRDMQVVARIEIGISPRRLAIDDETGQVFVADYAGQSLVVIEQYSVTQSISLGALPYSIVFCPKSDLIYVFEEETRQVAVFGRRGE